MKVALVHMRQRGTGGTERYLNQVAVYLAERGHDVTIVCRSHERPPHPSVHFVVLRAPVVGATWRMWAFAKDVERHVRSTPYGVVFGLGKTWTHDVTRLGGGCEETYLELAHQDTLQPWERLFHNGRLKHRVALAIERRALSSGAYRRVITNSIMVKRDVMTRYAVPADRIAVIYNGVDLDRFHPRHRDSEGAKLREACGLTPNDFVILFLGTGYGRKGLSQLLDAFPLLLRERPRARLLVVGYDSAQAAFEQAATAAGIGSYVRFLGGRRDPEVCFGAADLYVLPTHYDPFANSTLEALASGVPVITSSSNGASELITNDVDGSVVSVDRESDVLLKALLQWTDPECARRGAVAARRLAERYPQANTAAASAAALESVLAEKHAEQQRERA